MLLIFIEGFCEKKDGLPQRLVDFYINRFFPSGRKLDSFHGKCVFR